MFSYFKRMKTAHEWSDVTGFRSFDNSTCETVILDLLEARYLKLWEVVANRITVL